LFRASHHSAQLEIELFRRNIPFVKYGGLKFLEAAHVKDVISVFRWCENPSDRVAGFRVLKLLPGIGPTTAAKVQDQVGEQPGRADVLLSIEVPKAAAEDWPGFVKLVSRMRKAKTTWPAEFEAVRQWYEPHLERLYDDGHLRAADIAQLEQIAAGYETRERFLTELTLDPPDATSGRARANTLDEDYTILSTIHSAKGQEWRIVRILNVVDGCIPSDMATRTPEEIEEERRLLYVAMTRAKDELDLIVPQRFYTYQQSKTGDRHVYACRSRRMRLWTRLSAGAGVNTCKRRTGQPRSQARPLMLPPACCGCGGRRRATPRTDTDKEIRVSLSVAPKPIFILIAENASLLYVYFVKAILPCQGDRQKLFLQLMSTISSSLPVAPAIRCAIAWSCCCRPRPGCGRARSPV
jgi:ATP-dependent exoDNAse (exonuclease V) beta subunit